MILFVKIQLFVIFFFFIIFFSIILARRSMSSNYKDKRALIELSDKDKSEITEALSFIWTKLKYRLQTIAIDNNKAVLKYGKCTERLMINLIDNEDYINKEKFNNLQLELQAFKDNADKKESSHLGDTSLTINNNGGILLDNADTLLPTSTKFVIDTDYIKIIKKDLNDVNCSIESDPAEIWEKLNSKCHKLFGYNDKIKIAVKVEDLEWATNALPAYMYWNKLSDYHFLIDKWIIKINKCSTSSTSVPLSFAPLSIVKGKAKEVIDCNVVEVNTENEAEIENEVIKKRNCRQKNNDKEETGKQKENKFNKFGLKLNLIVMNDFKKVHSLLTAKDVDDKNSITHTLKVISEDPIEIIDEESANERVQQWSLQKNQITKINTAFKTFRLYHRMILIDIYNDINLIAQIKYPNQINKQRSFESKIICTQEGITERSERRLKSSAKRLQSLIKAGITFSQIIKTGMHVSHFETEEQFYQKFLATLNIESIKEMNEKSTARQVVNSKTLLEMDLSN